MRRSCVQPQSRRGAVAVLVACMLPVLLMVSGLVISLAQMQLVRTELTVAGDAAARAAARELSLTQDVELAKDKGIEVAALNTVAGDPLTLQRSDIQFGVNTPATAQDIANGSRPWAFAPWDGTGPINALRITASAPDGGIPFMFAPFFNAQTFQPVVETGAMQIDRDIVLVVDRSGSMSIDNVAPIDTAEYIEYRHAVHDYSSAMLGAAIGLRDSTADLAEFNARHSVAGQILAAHVIFGSYGSLATAPDHIAMIDALLHSLGADGTAVVDAHAGSRPNDPNFVIPTRWESLKNAVDSFVVTLENTIPEEKLGIAWFNDSAGIAQELTLTYDDIRPALDAIEPTGDTNVGEGMTLGMAELNHAMRSRPFAQKVLVVMTDGIDDGNPLADAVATQLTDSNFVVIHSITFGDGANQELMQATATNGGGRYWHAADAGALEEAYRAIAVDIPTVLTD